MALHLLKEDTNEFLRRICVIVAEDAVLAPALPALVWLMAAGAKGYALTAAHVQLCLTIVYEVPLQSPRALNPPCPPVGMADIQLVQRH